MRKMPRVIDDGQGNTIEIPALPQKEWHAKLAAIAGRPLTADETARAYKMADHNWTLRVVATELFGERIVDQFFGPPIEDD